MSYLKVFRVFVAHHASVLIGRRGWKVRALQKITGAVIKSPAPGTNENVFLISGSSSQQVEETYWYMERESSTFVSDELPLAVLPLSADLSTFLWVPPALTGILIGNRGENVKRIQMISGTRIFSRYRQDQTIFVVCGALEDTETARNLINLHIERTTGYSNCCLAVRNGSGVGVDPLMLPQLYCEFLQGNFQLFREIDDKLCMLARFLDYLCPVYGNEETSTSITIIRALLFSRRRDKPHAIFSRRKLTAYVCVVTVFVMYILLQTVLNQKEQNFQ